jgi:Zinc-finger associated domain (zf-AD)
MDIACRFCLRCDGHLIQIFDDNKPIDEIKNKIYECLGILADPGDSLPNYYCITCENNLELCYEFRCTSRNANDVLVQRLQNQIVIEDINQHDSQILTDGQLATMNGNNVYVINLVDEVVEMDQQELQLCQQEQLQNQSQQIELYEATDDVISLTDNEEDEEDEIITEQPQDMLTITKVISQQTAETSNDIENYLSPTFIQNYRVEDYIKCNVCRKYYIKMAEHKATHDEAMLAGCEQCEQTQKRIDNHNKRYHKKEG